MPVSATQVCLNVSQSILYKQIEPLHSTSVPKLTPGYSTVIMWQTIWLGQQVLIWSKKYENTIPEIAENVILHPIIYWHLGTYSILTS